MLVICTGTLTFSSQSFFSCFELIEKIMDLGKSMSLCFRDFEFPKSKISIQPDKVMDLGKSISRVQGTLIFLNQSFSAHL